PTVSEDAAPARTSAGWSGASGVVQPGEPGGPPVHEGGVAGASERSTGGPASDEDGWEAVRRCVEALRAADFVEAGRIAPTLPARVREPMEELIRTWNRRLTDVQKGLSQAIEEGARPLI